MRRPLLTGIVALSTALAVVPTGGGTMEPPIKIGVIEPLSGPVAASGNYVRMGAEIARDWINARGGVNGRPLRLLIEDDKSDPREAAGAARAPHIPYNTPARRLTAQRGPPRVEPLLRPRPARRWLGCVVRS